MTLPIPKGETRYEDFKGDICREPAQKVIAIFPNGATHCYKSASDASKQLGLNEGSIRCVLGGSKRTLNGIRWIYLDQ